MQYLKEDVRDRIIKAALEEFDKKGYCDSSMRVIANNAGIVMGNIYRYFKNKETLFNFTVGPVYDRISSAFLEIQRDIEKLNNPDENDKAVELIKCLYDKVLEASFGRSTELLILLDKSRGSKYENTKKELIEQIENILKIRVMPEVELKDTFIFYVISSAFVEGICVVLRDTHGHDKESVIGSLYNIIFCQLQKRI